MPTDGLEVTLWRVIGVIRLQVTSVFLPGVTEPPAVLIWGEHAYLYAGNANYEKVTAWVIPGRGE